MYWTLELASKIEDAPWPATKDELVDWASAVFWGDGSVEFLGTQGDPWDAQWDMFSALIGAVLAQWLLAPWHDRQLAGRMSV